MSMTSRILLGAGIVFGLIIIAPFGLLASGTYRLFYIPSETMRPTLDVGDKIVARMGQPGSLSRGDIVLVSNGAGIYVKRVAGLPGDRVAVHDGIVQLNGQAVAQRLVGEERVQPDQYGDTVRRRRICGGDHSCRPCLPARRQSRPFGGQPLPARGNGPRRAGAVERPSRHTGLLLLGNGPA
jgi:signal peptidase I